MLLFIEHSNLGIPKLFLHLIEQILEPSMQMSKYKQPSLQLMSILTLALSKVSLEVLKTSEALETKMEVGNFRLLIPKNTLSEIP